MEMNHDLEIAQAAELKNIYEIAEKAGIDAKYLVPFGTDKAKLIPQLGKDLQDRKDGKLVLVTAVTPTPAGEGKSTTTIGLIVLFHLSFTALTNSGSFSIALNQTSSSMNSFKGVYLCSSV